MPAGGGYRSRECRVEVLDKIVPSLVVKVDALFDPTYVLEAPFGATGLVLEIP